MATNTLTPYIQQSRGDLMTAENWNQVQGDIKEDITSQIQTALENINNHVARGVHLWQSNLERAEENHPHRTSYQRSFNRLDAGKEKIIKHGLKSFPLVDVYQLDYFPAICGSGENENTPRWLNFFLYHTSERIITVKTPTGTTKAVIEDPETQPFRVLFSEMLDLYKVRYTDTRTLDDLETDFWTAFWGAPNDQFDSDQYCHSPWFEKACRERLTVKALKDQGDWEDIWFKLQPRKTINFPTTPVNPPLPSDVNIPFNGTEAPTQIQVSHHDFDTTGIRLLANPIYPVGFTTGGAF